MAKCFIDFKCVAQELARADSNVVAANAASTVYARFDLCAKWDGLGVYARFQHQSAVYDVHLTDGAALIPWEVLKPTGFSVSLFGLDGAGGRLTSNVVFNSVARSIDFEGAEPIPATPALIDVIIKQVGECATDADRAEQAAEDAAESAEEAQRIAQSVRDDADAGKFDGAEGRQGPEGPKGEDGKDAVITSLDPAYFAMQVKEDGHLYIIRNDGETTPNFAINEDGHLVLLIG